MMNLLISLLFLLPQFQQKQYILPIEDYCGNIDIQIDFMKVQIEIQQTNDLKNLTIQDSNEDDTSTFYDIIQTEEDNSYLIEKAPCSKNILLEICSITEQNEVKINIIESNQICYLQTEDEEIQEEAIDCATADYVQCKNNRIQQCKFIDCLKQSKSADPIYLFSICIPTVFDDGQTKQICNWISNGDSYTDYSLLISDKSSSTWYYWTIVVIIVSLILCSICSLSCYYNFKIVRTNQAPFNVPRFCPDCLFPKSVYKQPDEQQIYDESLDDSISNDDPKITHGRYSDNQYQSPQGNLVEMKSKYEVPKFDLTDND